MMFVMYDAFTRLEERSAIFMRHTTTEKHQLGRLHPSNDLCQASIATRLALSTSETFEFIMISSNSLQYSDEEWSLPPSNSRRTNVEGGQSSSLRSTSMLNRQSLTVERLSSALSRPRMRSQMLDVLMPPMREKVVRHRRRYGPYVERESRIQQGAC